MAILADGTPLRGKLFIVEGIDGSGKSTQLDLLHKWLVSRGYLVAFSEWNSSPVVRQTTKRGKDDRLLSPVSFSLIHAADLADRIEHHILPALHAGAIVLADRYVYTAFARDVARGVDREWVRAIYRFAVRPTVAFYFRVPLDESLQRILVGRPEMKYYEAGLDLGLSEDPYESFSLFQGRILEEYERIVEESALTVIDAEKPLVQQQARMRKLIAPHLRGARKVEHRPWREVLSKEGLHGRYLDVAGAGEE
ncbi:MAG: thymidylate kinase [Chloroflexi bacterium]|nr:thymidylate kinase [Chloroflexota bacterium]MBI3762061.1 thymidylate kinase [Chloroflexota bacterium]